MLIREPFKQNCKLVLLVVLKHESLTYPFMPQRTTPLNSTLDTQHLTHIYLPDTLILIELFSKIVPCLIMRIIILFLRLK